MAEHKKVDLLEAKQQLYTDLYKVLDSSESHFKMKMLTADFFRRTGVKVVATNTEVETLDIAEMGRRQPMKVVSGYNVSIIFSDGDRF